jgi:hypothetical protein
MLIEKTTSPVAWFGPPPLLHGEAEGDFNRFFERLSGDLKALDFIEEVLAWDFTCHTWELFRWRRLKAELLNQCLRSELESLIKPYLTNDDEAGDDGSDGGAEPINQEDEPSRV